MDDVLSRNDLRDDKNYVVQYYSKHFEHIVDFLTTFLRPVPSIAKQMPCFQKKKLNWRTRPEERISANLDWTSSTQPLQRNTWLKTGSHHTKTWNRKFHRTTPPPPKYLFRDSSFHSNHKNPSEAPKRKKPRTQIVNYLGDDNDAQGKQKRRARLKKFRAQPYKYSKGELRRWLIF